MNKNLNFLSRFKISAFQIKKYSSFLSEGINKVITYILMLSILIGMILGTVQFIILNTVEKGLNSSLKQEEFQFEIKEGLLDFKNSPYKIEEGGTLVIIDTNKSLNESESFRITTVHKDISTVFVKDGIIVNQNGDEYKLKYSQIPFLNGEINNEVAINILTKAKPIKYVVFIIMILVTYISLMVNGLIISLLGMISNKINKAKLKYKDIFKISLYSLTLPTLLNLVFPIGSFKILIAIIYTTIAINNINK